MGKERYKIAYTGLKVGKHDFHFDVEDQFWAEFPDSSIQKSDLDVDVEVEKHTTMLILNFEINGLVEVPCDRCLENFNLFIESENRLIVKFGEETFEENDEILVLARSEADVDIKQYIYEFVHLALPMRIIHPDNADGSSNCDPEVLKRIDDLSVNDSTNVDPRWDNLKGFIEN